ncbi:unnamed protein product [Ixodes persulcatus]
MTAKQGCYCTARSMVTICGNFPLYSIPHDELQRMLRATGPIHSSEGVTGPSD